MFFINRNNCLVVRQILLLHYKPSFNKPADIIPLFYFFTEGLTFSDRVLHSQCLLPSAIGQYLDGGVFLTQHCTVFFNIYGLFDPEELLTNSVQDVSI